jgi:hypothetical protein
MDVLKCKLLEYAIMYSGKIMWGLDCDLEALRQELFKINNYIEILKELETNTLGEEPCIEEIPQTIVQKIDSYVAALERKKNINCRNC